jgi:hypothetical protein
MLRSGETLRTRPFHRPIPITDLPLIYAREHLFPYPSYGDTDPTPVPRAWRTVFVENDFLRIEVAPELGGRVYSLFDKRIDREILFSNPVVKPVRILPIWAFVSGGIEFNFPIAHSPTSIATVGCRHGVRDDYAFVRVGEREARTGMEWVVELGLASHAPVLVQRSAFRNRTPAAHPWMSWTIAAVHSTPETEFLHPPHRVLVHDDGVRESDWPGAGLDWDRTHRGMTALFWKPGSAAHFGAFHHDLGFGLLHLADPAALPGKKVWTYGHGPHRAWGEATTEPGLSYCELESGPLLDQSEKPRFPPGTEQRFEEYWIPLHERAAADRPAFPDLRLPPLDDPWLGAAHSRWQTDWERFAAGDQPLPASPVVTGLELEPALRREHGRGNPAATEPLALWLAFRGRPAEALPLLESDPRPTARRLAGLVLWKALGRPAEAVPWLAAGPLADPIATVELDELHAELGRPADRATLLARAPDHRRIVERRADLALALGDPAGTLRLLASRDWPREHQRYVRTELWRGARRALGQPPDPVPESLGEDNLARFGAYWSD